MKILFMPEAGNVNADLYLEEVVSKLTGLYSELIPDTSEHLLRDTSECLLDEYKRMYTTLFSTPLVIDFKSDNTYSLSHSAGALGYTQTKLYGCSRRTITDVEDAEDFFSKHVSAVLELYIKFSTVNKTNHDPKHTLSALKYPGVPKESLDGVRQVEFKFRMFLATSLFPSVWEKVEREIEPQIKILADFLRGVEKCKS